MKERETTARAAETTLRALAAGQAPAGDLIVAAVVNGEARSLADTAEAGGAPSWILVSDALGQRIYRRSVLFLIIVAMRELYGAAETELAARASANGALYCELVLPGGVTEARVARIEARMREIIAEDRPIVRRRIPREEAVRLFKQTRQIPKANLVNALPEDTVSIYTCGEQYDELDGLMLDRTGELGCFTLTRMEQGVFLRTPRGGGLRLPKPCFQPKFSQTLRDAKNWAKILRCEYLPDLNRILQFGRAGELIRVSEALHEKTIAEIADRIAAGAGTARLVLIAGPSSSGKTSFAQRLRVQLRVNGLSPVSVSLDDYFIDREKTPRTPEGAYDFESLRALDVELFNAHLIALMEGREVSLPRYDFVSGTRRDGAQPPLSIAPGQPILVEGIHGLNEALTHAIPRERKFKIYVSALTQLNIDMHNRIPTTDARLVRRLVRDYQFRGSSALKTLRQWPDVRRGEERNIFPFQEDADAVFNSALIYELAALRKYALPLLQAVAPGDPGYIEAQDLLRILRQFGELEDETDIPNNSILREFIGKSCFFTSSGELKA